MNKINFTESEAVTLLEANERRAKREDFDEVLLCPYCGHGPKTVCDHGCCGESSGHFERHHAIFKGRNDFVLVDPETGMETDDMERSRIEE